MGGYGEVVEHAAVTKRQNAGVALVTLLMLGAILATGALTLAVDFTRQNNVARQTEKTYKEQYAIQGGIQWGMAQVISLDGEAPPADKREISIGDNLVRVDFLGNATDGWRIEAKIVSSN